MFRDDDEAARARADALEIQKRELEQELESKEQQLLKQKEQLREQEQQLQTQQEIIDKQNALLPKEQLFQEKPSAPPKTNNAVQLAAALVALVILGAVFVLFLVSAPASRAPEPQRAKPSDAYHLPTPDIKLPEETCRVWCDPNLLISDALLKDCDCEALGLPKPKPFEERVKALTEGK
jgi:hypothetical protein